MAWIKRNLFFVIGGILTLGLLGGAGFYIYKGWQRNSDAFDKLNEIVGNLTTLNQKKPSPGNDKINNTQIAKEQVKELDAWISSTVRYFQPIPAIPPGNLTSATYAGALNLTISQLQGEAKENGVALPPKFNFSFSQQQGLMKFAGGSLQPLAVQLGEVKAMVEILFDARVNALDSVQRVRVSDDDLNGPQADYIDEHAVTNELAVITPYVITFRTFTPELAKVMAEFATASNTFIVKSVNVQRADAAGAMAVGVPGEMPPGMLPPGVMPGRPGFYGGYPAPGATAPAAGYQPTAGRGGLQTVLKEQLLQVRMEVELVKLLPKS